MNLVRGLLRKSPNPAAAPAPASPSVRGGGFPGADLDDAPAPRVVFSDSTEEGVLNTLWEKYENAHDQEHGWNSWLETSTKLDVIKDYKSVSKAEPDNVEINELILVRNLYSLVLSYYLSSVKGGWHQLEDTAHFFLLKFDQGQLSSSFLLRDILDDIVESLLQTSSEENIFLSQPGCDNVLHLLKLIQELLVNQIGIKLLFPSPSTTDEPSSDDKWKEDIKCTVNEILNAESNGQCRRSLLIVRSHYGQLDDGARFHVLSHLILETIIYGKSMLVTNILGRDDSIEVNSNKEAGFILSFIQKDRVLATAAYEVKHMQDVQADRLRKLQELHSKLNEYSTKETQLVQIIDDQIQFSITSVLSVDDSRKAAFELAFDEDQQIVADKWIHIFRALIDERGPWSANPFPNDIVTHWKLDKTEDKWRRRFKLKRNYMFDERLCQPSSSRNENTEPYDDQPSFSTKVPEKMKRFLLKGVRGITDDSAYRPFEDTNDTSESSHNPSENQNQNNAADSSDHRTPVQNKKDTSSTNTDNDYTKGGKFDHADRLFQSIDSAYKNSLSNTSDVKELIPEFFYMPEFLENSNSYHLGVKQDGELLGDVALPPWAKASNIFYYVTYEGAVDLENMDDMLQKYAIEDQIANFGQTPIQIFRVKHPRRGPPIPIAHPLYFAPQSITLTSSVSSTISHMSSVLFIGLLDGTIVLMNEGLILSEKLWLTTRMQLGGNFTFSGPQVLPDYSATR
ncbi:hypothetical protein ACQ4PT_042104 [Festuca glaucescens]